MKKDLLIIMSAKILILAIFGKLITKITKKLK